MNNAIHIIKNGGIAIFPTDTAFAIGCRVDDPGAVDRLFAIRKRSITKATPVLVSDISMALAYFESPSDIVRHLMQTYWPGALTIVSNSKKNLVHSPVLGGGNTIGLRMPNHKTALHLIAGVGVGVIGTSANFAGLKTPYTYEELDPQLVSLVDVVVPGECTVGNVSTVVDCTTGKLTIIRQGAVTL